MSARWDIFARVVDNFGDAGVAWRLARQLVHEHGLDVTFFLDDIATLARFVPQVSPRTAEQRVLGVRIVRWTDAQPDTGDADVVVEAFGCGVPDPYAERAAARALPPPWFVLEYLSAESWVDGMHGLPSPHPRLQIVRRFWFPGFTGATGGLLRERDLFPARDAFQSDGEAQERWWASLRVDAPDTALKISLFCYPNPVLPALLDTWADGDLSIICIVPEGVATGALDRWTGGALPHPGGPPLVRDSIRLHVINFLGQDDYDRLLWASDLNFVRGEDSFVRAQWAARPFVWHAYPQQDGAHAAKIAAFAGRYTAGLDAGTIAGFRTFTGVWNSVSGAPIDSAWEEFAAALGHLNQHADGWAADLARLPELAAGLVRASERQL